MLNKLTMTMLVSIATVLFMTGVTFAEKGGKFDANVVHLTAAPGWIPKFPNGNPFGEIRIWLDTVTVEPAETLNFHVKINDLDCRGCWAFGDAVHGAEKFQVYRLYINEEPIFSFNTKSHTHTGNSRRTGDSYSTNIQAQANFSFDLVTDDLLFEIYLEPNHVLAMDGFLQQ